MFSLTVDSSAAEVVKFFNDDSRRVRAIANAVNNLAKEIQQAEIRHLHQTFHVRGERKTFMDRQAAIISPFASAKRGDLWARIRVGQKDRLLLSKYEVGGTHEPVRGPGIAIPKIGTARATIAANITPDLLYKTLGLRARGKIAVGRNGTFAIENVGVFQRGKGEPLKKLYTFRPSSRLAPTLRFTASALAVVQQRWEPLLNAEIKIAVDYGMRHQTNAFHSFANESGD